MTTISYDYVGRGPDTPALVDAALAAGRQGDVLGGLIDEPRAAIHGVTLDPAVVYDRDKLAAAVAHLASTIDQKPTDASVSAGRRRDVHRLPGEGRSRRGQGGPRGRARRAARGARHAGVDRDGRADGAGGTRPSPPPRPRRRRRPRIGWPPTWSSPSGKDSWTVAGTKLASLISFSTAADGTITPVLDEAGLDPIVKKLAKKAARAAKDAGLKRVGGRIVATGTSHEGRKLIMSRT